MIPCVLCSIIILGSLLAAILVDPASRWEKRISMNCTILSCFKEEKVSSSEFSTYRYWLYTTSISISDLYNATRMQMCINGDNVCVTKYDKIFQIGNTYICKFYKSNPSYLLLLDPEEDTIVSHITLIIIIFAILIVVPCQCILLICCLCRMHTSTLYEELE